MPRNFRITGIMLHANAAPCAYHCRYCQLATSKPNPASFTRYAALVDRFFDWKETPGNEGFEVWPWYGNSHEHSIEEQREICRLSLRQGFSCDSVLLGGLRHRPRKEMRDWLEARRALGINTVVATFSGHDAAHDYWNNQQGNYRFQLETLELAAEMGMRLQQRILLMRDSVPTLGSLLDDLDRIGQTRKSTEQSASAGTDTVRWAIPLFYSGRARRLETQRLDKRDFAALPERVADILRDDRVNWRSEQEWIEHVKETSDDEKAEESITLLLKVTEENLEWAAAHSCEEIVETLSERYRAAAALMPSRIELCEGYGDTSNEKVYFNLGQMERLWMEQYCIHHPGVLNLRETWFA